MQLRRMCPGWRERGGTPAGQDVSRLAKLRLSYLYSWAGCVQAGQVEVELPVHSWAGCVQVGQVEGELPVELGRVCPGWSS
jgi:hypothetical protein